MCNGERYIKTLAIVTIIFSVCKVLVSIESITLSELRDSIVPLSRNLSFFLLIIYAVYKRKNVARLILSGIATLGLISCVLLFISKWSDTRCSNDCNIWSDLSLNTVE